MSIITNLKRLIANKRTCMLVQTGMALVLLTACGSGQTKTVSFTDTAMGTIINGTLYVMDATDNSADKSQSEDADIESDIMNILNLLENNELSWRVEGSQIYNVNNSAGKQGMEVSDKIFGLLKTCIDVSEHSDGAFDITIGDVTRLWNIDLWADNEISGEYELPDTDAVEEALKYTGYEKIVLDNGLVTLPENMNIDLGAVGKGAALDDIKEYLEENQKVQGAVISVGGSILTYGNKETNEGKNTLSGDILWKVGIADPFDTSKRLGVLSLPGGYCVSTSGDYERYVEVDGVRYHHIMNPATGYPADSGVHSVTIVSESGVLSDALSTACFVLGTDKGLKLAEYYGAEALFVDDDENIIMTDGMRSFFSQ